MACIGFTSGPASVFGTPMMQSARMVVDQINENGGILGEREIEMEEFDENVDDEVVQQYRRLATRERVRRDRRLHLQCERAVDRADRGGTRAADGRLGHGNDEPVRRRGDGSAVHLPNVCEQFDRRGRRGAVTAERAPRRRDRRRRQSGLRVRAEQLGPVQRAVESLGIDVELVDARFTPFPNDDYSSTISALNDTNPDFIYSSHWGGDAVNFITQANNQGLFDDTLPCFTAGSHVIGNIPDEIPENILFGARGPHYPFGDQQWNSLHGEFVQSYQDEYGEPPYAHGPSTPGRRSGRTSTRSSERTT